MAKNTPGTVPQSAPSESVVPVRTYRPKVIERQGVSTAPVTARYPEVRGGICEYCGVIDKRMPSEMQYRLCPHFREIGQLACSYCEDTKDPNEVINHSVINVAGHPDNPDKLVVWCNSFNCSKKHEERFKVSG